jgi:hypothetical protein
MDVPGVTSCHVKTVIITSTPWVLVLGTPTAATKQKMVCAINMVKNQQNPMALSSRTALYLLGREGGREGGRIVGVEVAVGGWRRIGEEVGWEGDGMGKQQREATKGGGSQMAN